VDDSKPIDDFEFVRVTALARILMPQSYVKIAAGRNTLHESTQALCLFAGANALFSGKKLLTISNVDDFDRALFDKLDIKIEDYRP
jgi:biotin synthase